MAATWGRATTIRTATRRRPKRMSNGRMRIGTGTEGVRTRRKKSTLRRRKARDTSASPTPRSVLVCTSEKADSPARSPLLRPWLGQHNSLVFNGTPPRRRCLPSLRPLPRSTPAHGRRSRLTRRRRRPRCGPPGSDQNRPAGRLPPPALRDRLAPRKDSVRAAKRHTLTSRRPNRGDRARTCLPRRQATGRGRS